MEEGFFPRKNVLAVDQISEFCVTTMADFSTKKTEVAQYISQDLESRIVNDPSKPPGLAQSEPKSATLKPKKGRLTELATTLTELGIVCTCIR